MWVQDPTVDLLARMVRETVELRDRIAALETHSHPQGSHGWTAGTVYTAEQSVKLQAQLEKAPPQEEAKTERRHPQTASMLRDWFDRMSVAEKRELYDRYGNTR